MEHSLKELQRIMWETISRPLTADYNMRKRWSGGVDASEVASTFVLANETLTSFERLQIYNQQYWYRVLDCFEDDFPGLLAVLGRRKFNRLAREYLQTHPSRSFSLRDLGQFLVPFLEKHRELIEPDAELCFELARFEWAQVVAFDGESFPPISEQHIREVFPEQLKVSLQPYITMLELNYELDDYSVALTRHQRDRGEAGSGKKKSARAPKAPWPVPGKVHLVVHRHENMVYFKRLDAPAFVTLSSLARGRSLNDALLDLVSYLEEHDLDSANLQESIQRWFSLWIRLGWLCVIQ